jgi:hypothetical protein
MDKVRYGKFSISTATLLKLYEAQLNGVATGRILALQRFMNNVVITRAEHMYFSNVTSYEGFSPLFEEIPRSVRPPEYLIQLSDTGGLSVIKRS